jgi:hypothetical protein
MRCTVWLGWAAALALMAAAGRTADAVAVGSDPHRGGAPTITQQAEKLIQALGAEAYADRLAAREGLLRLGRAAIEPLEAATQAEDTEVRLRAVELLITLRGRGFMGIGLAEEWRERGANAAEDELSPPPLVRVTQVLDHANLAPTTGMVLAVPGPLPAETAGLQVGDAILSINERPIRGVKDLMREVIIVGPGRVILADVERDGKVLRIPMLLTRNPMPAANEPPVPPPVDLERETAPAAAVNAPAPAPAQPVPRNILEMPAPVGGVDQGAPPGAPKK